MEHKWLNGLSCGASKPLKTKGFKSKKDIKRWLSLGHRLHEIKNIGLKREIEILYWIGGFNKSDTEMEAIKENEKSWARGLSVKSARALKSKDASCKNDVLWWINRGYKLIQVKGINKQMEKEILEWLGLHEYPAIPS